MTLGFLAGHTSLTLLEMNSIDVFLNHHIHIYMDLDTLLKNLESHVIRLNSYQKLDKLPQTVLKCPEILLG